MRISDWSSDVCSSDLAKLLGEFGHRACMIEMSMCDQHLLDRHAVVLRTLQQAFGLAAGIDQRAAHRSEEHTSELQSLMRNSYAVFCLKKKNSHQKSSGDANKGERRSEEE